MDGSDPYGGKKIWLTEVYCNGGEKNLASCQHAEWGKNDCKSIVEIVCHNEILGMRIYSIRYMLRLIQLLFIK